MGDKIEVLVDGGKASAGPPLGPALGPMGVNVMNVVNEINAKTKEFVGMKVPVVVDIDPKTKKFDVTVGTPPTSALLLKELGIEKGSGDPRNNIVGNVTVDQVAKIARMKRDSLMGADMRACAKEVAGTANSVGVTIEGLRATEFQKKLDEGEYADQLKE